MRSSDPFLTASEAAARLGISVKALRLYEARGLIAPVRTVAGWRTYGAIQMARAREIVALRALGLSLAQVGDVLDGRPAALAAALDSHQQTLERELRLVGERLARVAAKRLQLQQGSTPVADLLAPRMPAIAFDLPWPWGGERFSLEALGPLSFLSGPLGSGKTRLAQRIAAAVPGALFVGLDRASDMSAARQRLNADAGLSARVEAALDWLTGEGAAHCDALLALLACLEDERPSAMVVDLVEQGLDQPAQEALVAYLRRRAPDAPPLVLMTRSTAILDLELVGATETILYCPANHAPPMIVKPWPGAPGREALASCLAAPQVRARTEGVVAMRPPAVG